MKLLKSILSEIETPTGVARTESFAGLRDVGGKINEVRMILSGVDCLPSILVDDMNSDSDFEANSRRVRLEALANYVRSTINFLDVGKGQNDLPGRSDEVGNIDHFKLIEHVCSKFHLIARQLKTRHANRNTFLIEDEYDVLDLLHALRHLYFEDIRKEEWSPSYAGGCSRIDFLLKEEKIIIEVKKTRETLKAKDLGDQLIVDSEKYRTHPDCKKIFCL